MMKKLVFSLIFFFGLISYSAYADYDGYVNVQNLNIRLSTSSNSKIISIVNKGYKLSVVEDLQSGWKKVMLGDGRIGYVNGKYITTELPKYIDGTKYSVISDNVFLRGLDLNKKVAILNKGDTLEVLNNLLYKDNWMHVKVVSSKNEKYVAREGYISKKFVESIVSNESLDDNYDTDLNYDYEDYSTGGEDLKNKPDFVVKELSDEDLSILKSDTFIEGSTGATYTIFNILDTECPACKTIHDQNIVQDLVKKSDGSINSVYVPYPLDYHENALMEAKAIYCAGNLGGQSAYNNYISEVFSKNDGTQGTGFSTLEIVPLAKKLGLNEDDFNKCLKDNETETKISSKSDSLANIFSISSIPTIVILNNETKKYVTLDLGMIDYYSELSDKIIDGIVKIYSE